MRECLVRQRTRPQHERSEDTWVETDACNNSPHEVYSDDDDDLDLNALTASPSAGPFEDEDQGT